VRCGQQDLLGYSDVRASGSRIEHGQSALDLLVIEPTPAREVILRRLATVRDQRAGVDAVEDV